MCARTRKAKQTEIRENKQAKNIYSAYIDTMCLFACLSVCLFVCLSVCLSVCLFVHFVYVLGARGDGSQIKKQINIPTVCGDFAKERMWTFDADYVTRNSGSS